MPLTVMSLSAIAASISAQFFNSWQSNKKSKELIARQREFQRAAQEKDFVRMRRIQQEAEQLALELENEVHQQRLKDIESNYDEIIEDFAKQFTIKLWPLKVLPFVMRGESFGTIINGTKSVALHCILTPSNCNQFNRAVYQDIDLRLESLCNEYWNAQSTHPIVYYGDSWRKSELDLVDIELLHTQLKSIPTIVITPYFSPNLYFRVKLWGMGKDSDFIIQIPNNLFSYEYYKNMEYFPEDEEPLDDIYNHTIEEFVPYLECLIGFFVDEYFWKHYKILPILPQIINNSNWDKELIKLYNLEYASQFQEMINGIRNHEDPLNCAKIKNILSYIDVISFNQELQFKLLQTLNDTVFSTYSTKKIISNMDLNNFELINNYNLSKGYSISFTEDFITKKTEIKNVEFETIEVANPDFIFINSFIDERIDNTNLCTTFYFCLWNEHILIGCFGMNDKHHSIYLKENTQRYFIFYTKDMIDIDPVNTQYFKINVSSKKIFKMEKKNFEEKFGNQFQKIGKSFGRIFDSMALEEKKEQASTVWDGPKENSSKDNYLEKIVSYFVDRINAESVEAEFVSDIKMQTFLDWIDQHYFKDATKTYIVKGFVEDKKKHLICIFFASDNKAFINEKDAAKCFIMNELSPEISNMFGDNNLCEIPLI